VLTANSLSTKVQNRMGKRETRSAEGKGRGEEKGVLWALGFVNAGKLRRGKNSGRLPLFFQTRGGGKASFEGGKKRGGLNRGSLRMKRQKRRKNYIASRFRCQ